MLDYPSVYLLQWETPLRKGKVLRGNRDLGSNKGEPRTFTRWTIIVLLESVANSIGLHFSKRHNCLLQNFLHITKNCAIHMEPFMPEPRFWMRTVLLLDFFGLLPHHHVGSSCPMLSQKGVGHIGHGELPPGPHHPGKCCHNPGKYGYWGWKSPAVLLNHQTAWCEPRSLSFSDVQVKSSGQHTNSMAYWYIFLGHRCLIHRFKDPTCNQYPINLITATVLQNVKIHELTIIS